MAASAYAVVVAARPDGLTLSYASAQTIVVNPWVQKGMSDTLTGAPADLPDHGRSICAGRQPEDAGQHGRRAGGAAGCASKMQARARPRLYL